MRPDAKPDIVDSHVHVVATDGYTMTPS